MSTPSRFGKLFAVLFLAATAGGGIANIMCQRETLRAAFAGFSFPAPVRKMLRQLRPFEEALSENILGRRHFVDARSRLQVLQGRRTVEDLSLIRDENGIVGYGAPFPVDTSRLHEYAARLYWLSRYATGNGARVIFFNPPDRVVPRFSNYGRGLPFRNLNPAQDSFLFYLGEYGVHYFDARTALANSDLPPPEWLFRTHDAWTPQAAFAAFRALVPEMNQVFGAALDPGGDYTDTVNYDFVKLSCPFRGDLGRATGCAFSGTDVYTAISPKFASDYELEWVGLDGKYGAAEGEAGGTLFNPAALRCDDPATFAPYDFRLSGMKRWTRIRNRLHPERPSLLVIHGRQGFDLIPLLAPLFGETHSILSAAGDYAVNIDQYLSSRRFDYIIIALEPTSYDDAGMNFFTGPKD